MAETLEKDRDLTFQTVSVGVASTEILKANPKRRYLLIQNISDTPLTIRAGGHVSATTGIILAPAYVATSGRDYNAPSMIEFSPSKNNLNREAVYAISGVAGKNILVVEGHLDGEQAAATTGGRDGVSSSSSSGSSPSSGSSSSSSPSSPSSASSASSASSSDSSESSSSP